MTDNPHLIHFYDDLGDIFYITYDGDIFKGDDWLNRMRVVGGNYSNVMEQVGETCHP